MPSTTAGSMNKTKSISFSARSEPAQTTCWCQVLVRFYSNDGGDEEIPHSDTSLPCPDDNRITKRTHQRLDVSRFKGTWSRRTERMLVNKHCLFQTPSRDLIRHYYIDGIFSLCFLEGKRKSHAPIGWAQQIQRIRLQIVPCLASSILSSPNDSIPFI